MTFSYNGIATHYIHSSSLPDLENRLAELTFKDYVSLEDRHRIINSTIEEFVTGLPHDVPMSLDRVKRQAIDRCFAHESIDQILQALENEGSSWSQQTLKTIRQRSPTSVKVTLRQMKIAGNWTISEAFKREYHIASKFMEHPDFVEGVSSLLIRKPKTTPQWQPETLAKISDETVASFFNVSGEKQLQLLREGPETEYTKYPHGWIGLPTEDEVRNVVRQGGKDRSGIVDYFVQQKEGKLGVKEKISEILSRKTETDQNGQLRWTD